jgi:lipoyl(octanoyl) transferase
MMKCILRDLGLVPYEEAWRLQDEVALQVARGESPPTLLLLEHPHTFTFGRRGREEHLLWGRQELAERGVDVHWVDRGGDVTYHGPGQLVGYPLLPLGPLDTTGRLPQADYLGYVRNLEKAIILALARLGLPSGQVAGLTGVWVQPDLASRCPRCRPQDRLKPAKIAAIGVKIDARGVTRHGFALNVDPDMSYWEGVVACGLQDYPAVSLADLLAPAPAMATVRREVAAAFGEIFGFRMLPGPGTAGESN